MSEDRAKLPPTDWDHSTATGMAKVAPDRKLEERNYLDPDNRNWIRRAFDKARKNPIIVAGVAAVVAVSLIGTGELIAPNKQNNSSEQTAPPVLVFTGEFDVSSSYVNSLHVTEFGGIKVSPDITYYRILLGRVAKDQNGQEVLDVLTLDPAGQAFTAEIPCDPAAKVGEGPQGGAIVSKEGTVTSFGPNATSADGLHDTIGQLSQAIPEKGLLPTPQP